MSKSWSHSRCQENPGKLCGSNPLQASIELHPTSEMCSPCSQTSVNHRSEANRTKPSRPPIPRQAAAVVGMVPSAAAKSWPSWRYPWDPNFCKTENLELHGAPKEPSKCAKLWAKHLHSPSKHKNHDKTTQIVISTQWHHPGVARPLAASCCLTTARRVAGGSIGQHHLPWQC